MLSSKVKIEIDVVEVGKVDLNNEWSGEQGVVIVNNQHQ